MKEKILIIKYWIGDNEKKIKLWLLIFLVATLSFGLGYLVNQEFSRTPIVIEKCSDA
ncbi:hypothetical protein HZB05_01725 [Candidatus Wolfebacteria bacterium]|nr:hypothetical protein [Candidatus Wolfebacteria bacterium]